MKLGCTSYVYPADAVSNAERLCGVTEDVELLIFEGADREVLPTRADISRLREISASGGFSYTVHLPLDIDVCSADPEFRVFSLKRAEEITDLAATLEPRGFVLHLPGGEGEGWTERACRAVDRLISRARADVFVENLTYPFSRLVPVFEQTGAQLCLDTGHAHKAGDDWREIYRSFAGKTGVVHLYAPDPAGSDRHLGLQHAPLGFVSAVTRALVESEYSGVLTIELFCEDDFFKSKEIVEREIEKWEKG